MKVAATDPLAPFDQGSTAGVIAGGSAADAIADHEDDVSDAHHASGISITNGAAGVSQWPMLGLSSGTATVGPYFGGATNVQQALEYLAQAIQQLSGTTPAVPRHWPMLGLSSGGGDSTPVSAWLSRNNGGMGLVAAHGNMGSTETIDLGAGNYHWGTLDDNCTLTFTGATNLFECWFTLELIENGTGGWSPTWPGSVSWLGGSTPTHDTTAGTTTIYAFFTRDGGTTWIGGELGGGSGGTPATTVTDETTFGITPAVGTDTEYARQDHTHGSPANPVTAAAVSALGYTGGLLLASDHTNPITFDDILQASDGSDFLYASEP